MELRKTVVLIGALLLIIGMSGVAVADEDPQSGSTTTCTDFNVLWLADGIVLAQELNTSSYVDVDPGQQFELTSDSGSAKIDFFTEDGIWITGAEGSGTVPDVADFGVVCVGQGLSFWPDAPAPTATFTYHDEPVE